MAYTMFTATGRKIDPLNLRPEDIILDDIAHALSNVCRYGGHVREFYSVAQHCVLMSEAVPPRLAKVALLHDASEAYVGDMVRPLKQQFPAFEEEVERQAIEAVFERFDVDLDLLPELKPYDLGISIDEMSTLMVKGVDPHLFSNAMPLNIQISPWSPRSAKNLFLVRAQQLML